MISCKVLRAELGKREESVIFAETQVFVGAAVCCVVHNLIYYIMDTLNETRCKTYESSVVRVSSLYVY